MAPNATVVVHGMGRIRFEPAARVVAAGRRGATRRRTTTRAVNLSLFATLMLVFATGVGAVATGSAGGRWTVVAHGVVAFMVILLIPWKTIVIRRGLRRRRLSRWVSLLLALMVVTTLVTGMVSVTGLVRTVGGFLTLWWHIAVALALVPLLLWHLISRPVRLRRMRLPSSPDLSRRAALRLAAVAGGAAVAYSVGELALRLAGAPGARRRFTGSHEVASSDPAAMPVTSWLDDRVPTVDVGQWRLAVDDATGRRELTLADLAGSETTVRATLDCTSGWYADHTWTGVPVSALLAPSAGVRSLYVHSVTGYWVRLPVADIDSLLLATAVGGHTLSRGHGFPLRLVAPGRRGFWWVKWVDQIALDTAPPWWQPPFPLT
jgi:Oxidoreductase molybdopterin binding domain